MLKKNTKKDLPQNHSLTMGENPALEWNIGVIPENRSISDDSIIINPIVSPLNIRVAVAPAIVCDNPCKTSDQIVSEAYLSSLKNPFYFNFYQDNLQTNFV